MSVKKLFAVISALCMSISIFALTACGDNENNETVNQPCEHTVVKVDPKDPDCTHTGNYAHYACSKCGEIFSDSKGEKPISEEKILIEKLPHATLVQNESVGNYSKFYYCSTCGHYFADKGAKTEIPYSELVDKSVTPKKLSSLSGDGNVLVTKSYNAQSEFEDIKGDFTLRMFAGWRSGEGKGISEFPSGQTIQVNFNLNRIETITPPVPGDIWYNFGIAYNVSTGLTYKKLQGANSSAKGEFNQLFIQNGGIYIRVVRKGATVSFYFEDKFGMPRLIDSNDEFRENGTLVRFAANTASKVDGWAPFVEKAEICLGIANPRCAFSDK